MIWNSQPASIIVDLSHVGPIMTNGIMDHMDKKHPGVPYVFTHSLPAGLFKDAPKATPQRLLPQHYRRGGQACRQVRRL